MCVIKLFKSLLLLYTIISAVCKPPSELMHRGHAMLDVVDENFAKVFKIM